MALRARPATWLTVLALGASACSTAAADPAIPPYLAEEAAAATGFQAEALADDVITTDELETASSNVERCLGEHGVAAESFSFEFGDFRVRFAASSEAGLDAAEDVLQHCMAAEYDLIAGVFDWQNRPTGDESAELEAELAACVADMGHPVDGIDEIYTPDFDAGARSTCLEAFEEALWAERSR